jgi:tetratricopeptide (TPR) repeat protein
MHQYSPEKLRLRSERLDSWKSVADYLSRSLRTVQRWHERYDLPIHRIGGESGSVFAFTEELDVWMKRRGETAPEENTPQGPARGDLSSSFPNDTESVGGAQEEASRLVSTALKMWEYLSTENIDQIIRANQKAVLLDPSNGYAFAGLSLALIAENLLGIPPTSGYRSAQVALNRAIELVPEALETQCATSWLSMVVDHDWNKTRQAFTRILDSYDSCRSAIVGMGLLHIAEGHLAEAGESFFRAAELDPLSMPATAFQLWSEYLQGNYKRAMMLVSEMRVSGHAGPLLDSLDSLLAFHLFGPGEVIRRLTARTQDPLCPPLFLGLLGHAYALSGERDTARALLNSLENLEVRPIGQFGYSVAIISAALGENEAAVEALKRSYRRGSLWSFGFLSDPLLADLRRSPHFQRFTFSCPYPR